MESETVCTGNTFHNLFLPKLSSFCSKPGCLSDILTYPSQRRQRRAVCQKAPELRVSIQNAPPEKGAFPHC